MKTIFKLLAAASLVAFLGSCVGKEEPKGIVHFVKLTTAKAQVDVDKAEKMVFSVTADGIDVTNQTTIVNTTDGRYEILKDKEGKNVYEFEPLKPANHRFIAIFDESSSEPLEVRAISSASQSDVFYRRNCLMKFTGTWCKYCPDMGERIKDVAKKRTDRLVEIAVHNSDDLEIATGKELARYAGASALPEVMVDYRAETRVTFRTELALTQEMDRSNADNPTVAGVKMKVVKNGSKFDISTETMVTRNGEYRLVVAILVDGYAYEQTGASDPNYRQNCVLRAYLSKDADMMGDKLGEEATNFSMVAGERSTRNYSYTMDGVNDHTRYRVAAFVLNKTPNGEFRINNIVQCNIGQEVDYQYEAKTE